MTSKWMASVAMIALLAPGAARAQSADIPALKAQTEALKAQNIELEQRLDKLEQRQAVAAQPAPASSDFLAQVTKGPLEAVADDGPICWKGVCIFGAVDAGVGWVSHGLPENGKNYEGESLLNKFGNRPYFGVAQNNLQQSTIGVKGEIELLPGVAGVFMASTGFNPQSGQLANMPGTMVDNQGLNRNSYSFVGDGGRGGQAFNDQLFVGLSSKEFGQLTFGRHRPFSVDMVNAYDPTGGAYAFSPIAFNGQYVQGLGATESARWDDSFKYKVAYGPAHFGAMYKFADGSGGCNYTGTATNPAFSTAVATPQTCYTPHNDAYQFNLGGSYGGFDFDAIFGVYHQALVMAGGNAPLSAAQLTQSTFTTNTGVSTYSTGSNLNTLQALVSDNTAFALSGKYTWEQYKFFVGYAHDELQNPQDNLGIGATNDQGGYRLSQVNNAFYAHPRVLQTVWTGVKYAYDPKTDITVAYYHVNQNQYGSAGQDATCGNTRQNLRAAQCAGTMDAVSAFVDYHFTKRFDVYAGLQVNNFGGGLAGGTYTQAGVYKDYGYNYYTNWAPVAGARYSF